MVLLLVHIISDKEILLNRSEFYNDSVNHIYNLGDFARGNENQPFTFFEREGVPNKIKVAGDDIYRYLTAQVDA